VASSSVAERLSEIRALRAGGKLAEAQARLEELALRSPDDPRLEVERVALLDARRDPEARAAAERAVARYPGSAPCWIALAKIALRTPPADPETAVAAARQAVSLSPRARSAHLQLARAERARGRLAEALEAVRAGLRVEARDALLRGLEVEILRQMGRGEEAAHAADALPEGSWKARQKLEGSLARLAPEEAEAELEALAALEPDRVEVHERLGNRRYRARRFAEAAASFARALEIEPGNAYLRRMAGFACSKAGEPARAMALLRPLFIENPLDAHVRTTFVSACRRSGDIACLRAAIDEALGRHPSARMLHGIRKRHAPDPAGQSGPP